MTESQVANEWIAKGVLNDRREMLLRLLNKRFPGTIPADVTKLINEQESPDLLNDWFDAAVDAGTFTAFIVALKH